jgi:hypothetical protein
MRTNFLPNLQMNPLAIAQMGAGVAQGIFGAIQAGKAQKQLNKLQSPQYKQNQSIMDFYNEALKRYNVSPTDSAMYKRQMQSVNRNMANALNGYGNESVSSILRAGNDAALNANVAAEAERSNRFGQLGSAAGMKAGEDDKAFQFNQYMPFERKYNLLSQKAGGGNQIMNAGISNIFGGLQGWNQMNMIDKMYPKK